MEKVTLLQDSSKRGNVSGLTLCPGINLLNGSKEFETEFGKPTSLETDLLNLGAAVFASDLAIKRGEREQLPRNIEVTIPVTNLASFKSVAEEITGALYVLSHDVWKLNFVKQKGKPEEVKDWETQEKGKVLLFSGGLDSLSAAVKFAKDGETIQLVSHITANQVIYKTQESLYKHLESCYPGQFQRTAFRVSGIGKPKKGFPFPSDDEREETQRTRSFMFLTLAALFARRRGYQDIVMIAENGQMAIHLPLSAARISAFSTHTAHPEFIELMSEILTKVLGYKIDIQNPFLYLTKSEVVQYLFPDHKKIIAKTISCWKASRVSKNYHHCGICIPCFIRRIALEKNDVALLEYERNLFKENILALPSDDEGKRNLAELCEFITMFREEHTLAEYEVIYPDLLNSSFDMGRAIAMYRRFAEEALSVVWKYPSVRSLIEE